MKVIKAQFCLLSNTAGPVGEIEKTLSDKIFTAVTQTQKKNCAACVYNNICKKVSIGCLCSKAQLSWLRSLQLSLMG